MSGKDPKLAESIRSLARQVVRAESTVRKWLKRSDWPFGKMGPWKVRDVIKWMSIHLKRDPAQRYHDAKKGIGVKPLSELEKARQDNYLESAAIRKLKRLEMEGRLHDVGECRRRRVRQIHAVKTALMRLPRIVAPELIGKSRTVIEKALRKHMRQIVESFAKGGE